LRQTNNALSREAMMKWFLVIYIGFGNGGGPAVIEFSDMNECYKVGHDG
jgi:hypothetical protein